MILSGASALFCLFGAKYMIPSNQPGATLALQVLAPTIFLSGILGVYRGYFQAHSNMLPTSLSQIIEQILNAAVSIGAAWLFIHFFSDGTKAVSYTHLSVAELEAQDVLVEDLFNSIEE